jgi:hypothetical protein
MDLGATAGHRYAARTRELQVVGSIVAIAQVDRHDGLNSYATPALNCQENASSESLSKVTPPEESLSKSTRE